jgi:anti-sigma factor RsiW
VSAHVTDRLSAYLDGALPASALGRVQAHLETCAACARTYDELRALRRLLRGLPDPAAPAGLVDRIHWRLVRDAAAGAPAATPWRALWAGLTRPSAGRPARVVLAAATLVVIMALPMGWLAGVLAPHGTSFDSDAYVRDYLLLSSDRLTDDVTRTVIAHTALPESTTAR